MFCGILSSMKNFICPNNTLWKADEIVSKSNIILMHAASNTERKS